MNTQENRTSMTSYARAGAAFLALFCMGYVVSTTQVESATDVLPAVTAPQQLTPTAYFPAQFVNQGQATEDHIQAF